MIDLDHEIWQQLEGPHGTPYNAAIPLKQLSEVNDPKEINKILNKLWIGLHFEGRVGLASYLALPQLIAIAKEKNIFNWLLLLIVSVVEQRRHLGDNPELPASLVKYYNRGLDDFKEYVLVKMKDEHNKLTQTTALATIATCDGQPKLGKAIQELNDSYVLDEFLLAY